MKIKRNALLIVALLILILIPTKASASSATLEFKHKDFEDDKIITEIYLKTGSLYVNAVIADFTCPSELLEIQEINIEDSLFDNFIKKDYSNAGTVYLSCYSSSGIRDEGNVATITFRALQEGEASLEFTNDASILKMADSSNILSEATSANYTISQDQLSLPETGTTEEVVTVTGLMILILLAMIILFTLMGFTLWGGIYFSLGKWEVKTEAGVELGKKGKGKKKPKLVAKAKRGKKK